LLEALQGRGARGGIPPIAGGRPGNPFAPAPQPSVPSRDFPFFGTPAPIVGPEQPGIGTAVPNSGLGGLPGLPSDGGLGSGGFGFGQGGAGVGTGVPTGNSSFPGASPISDNPASTPAATPAVDAPTPPEAPPPELTPEEPPPELTPEEDPPIGGPAPLIGALEDPYAAFAQGQPGQTFGFGPLGDDPYGIAGTPAADAYAGAGAFGMGGYAGNDPAGPDISGTPAADAYAGVGAFGEAGYAGNDPDGPADDDDDDDDADD
jgi:hypothetical protein